MTDLVSLPFVAMIPIDCKITNFSLYLLFILFATIIILVNSQAPLQKKEWPRILFLRVPCTPINLWKVHMPVSLVFAYIWFPIAQRYRQKKAWKYLFLPLARWKYGKSIRESVHSGQDLLVTVKRQKGNNASCSVLSNNYRFDLIFDLNSYQSA